MSAAPATVLTVPNRGDSIPNVADIRARRESNEARFGAIDDLLIVIGDMELEAFGRLFAKSRLKRGMTFEAYLAVKGFARSVPKRATCSGREA